jgi:hypothetical protein
MGEAQQQRRFETIGQGIEQLVSSIEYLFRFIEQHWRWNEKERSLCVNDTCVYHDRLSDRPILYDTVLRYGTTMSQLLFVLHNFLHT